MTVIFLVLLVALAFGYTFLLARFSTYAAPDYNIPSGSSAPPLPSKVDRDEALKNCTDNERKKILDLYDSLVANRTAYDQLQEKISKNRYLYIAVFLPLVVAGDLYRTASIWAAIAYVAVYAFFVWYFRAHIGLTSYDAKAIPEVDLYHRQYSSADELIHDWNRALDLTGYPLMHNIEAYDKLHKESRGFFILVAVMSLAPYLIPLRRY